jgi:tetratricopeptide (TPR) repeat protein
MDPRASRALARRREIVLCDDEGQDSSLHTIKAAMRWLLAASVVAGATLATVTASAQASTAACIEDKTKQSFTCSGVGPRELDASQRRTGVDLHAVQPPARASAPARPPAPTAVEGGPRDDRKIRLEARQRGLLAVEVQRIETLLAGTRKNASDRHQIARRLADGYVELESAAFRDKTEAEIRRDALKPKNAAAAGAEQTHANEADRVMKGARKRAIELYALIAADYPTHPLLDEVLYYLAYEYEQAGDAKNARAVYYELIQKAPTSKYVPNAYLAFGELFFNEAQGDPSKWDLAAQAYTEVVKYPAPANKALGYAWYKLAYVFWNKGELDKSLNAFKKTIDFGVGNPGLPGASKLADSARRDVIPVYALKGDPEKAYAFMHGMSGDPPGTNDKTFRMLDDLGNNYIDTGHYPEGIVVYKDLISRDKGGRVCGYQARITDATMAMKSADKVAIKAELEKQLEVASAFKSSSFDKEQKQVCANRTAALVTETAMAWHLEAVGSQGQRGTGDVRTMALAAALYKRVVDSWTSAELASFQFPRLVKEDWPTLFKIKYAMADLLYFQKDWARCGPAFDSVVAEDPSGPEAPKAAYAAGLCFQNVYEESHKDNAGLRSAGNLPGRGHHAATPDDATRLRPKDMKGDQAAMVKAFDRYVCTIKPAANDAAGQEQLVEVKYARARTYFEAQHWDEAAYAFREIALNHADRDVGIYAAQLYLESANVMKQHFGKTRCEDEMRADVPRFVELYCGADKGTRNADSCTSLRYVQVDLLRLEAERRVAKADNEGGGQAYFELFRKYCQDPVAAGKPPEAERCDEIAYNAAKAFQAARLLAKSITVRRALLAFDERTHMSSALAKKATYEIAANYQAIAVYDSAAEWYERFARGNPRAEHADQALADAVLLRLGLGQELEAIKDAQDFGKAYGAAKPAQSAAIAFAIGAHYAEKEEWEKARGALTGSMSIIDRAPPDVQLQAHATLGRTFARLNNAASARAEYAKVKHLWTDPAAGEAKIRAAYPAEDDAQRERRLGKALGAVGEAMFFAAEERRIGDVDSLKFPEYKGPGDKASVKAHVDTKVKDWYLKKMAAIQKVERQYLEVLELKPAPPPKWVIAAGSRSGLMWGDFVDDFRRSPIPKAWRGTELEQMYTGEIDRVSEPYKSNHARPALKKCLDLSTKYQYFDAFSRSCEVWLAKNYKAEYHVTDELRGAPTMANSGLDEKAPPVLMGGAFWHPAVATR